MTSPATVRRLPQHVKQAHRESADSYLRRLFQTNLLSPATQKTLRAQTKTASPSDHPAAEQLAAKLGRFRPFAPSNAFHTNDETCPDCILALGTRYACERCTQGAHAAQMRHADKNVCTRHNRWIGPQSPQQQISAAVLRAERRYRRLCRTGRATPTLMQQVTTITETAIRAHGITPTAENTYPTVICLIDMLNDQLTTDAICDPSHTFADAYSLLEQHLVNALGDVQPPLVDGLWLMLRPTFAAVRAALDGRPFDLNPHHVPAPQNLPAVWRPLEPFSRYLEQRRTHRTNRIADTLSWLDIEPISVEGAKRSRIRANLCPRGHQFPKYPHATLDAINIGAYGCAICAHKVALPGYNSMLETHPWMGALWHTERNSPTDPGTIMAGGNSRSYWWRCARGHEREATPNNISRGRGCSFCTRRYVVPGETSLLVTHPQLAAELDTEHNGTLTADDILAGSAKPLWWKCAHGHRWKSAVIVRTHGLAATASGGRCPTCRTQIPLETSVAACDPDVAAEWDTARNGVPPTAVRRTRTKAYWRWRCPQGHEYSATAASRNNGHRCKICERRIFVPGINDLQTIYPQLAAAFHSTLNDGQTSSQVDARRSSSYMWLCERGHTYRMTLNRRLQQKGNNPCTGQHLAPGSNDLATRHPQLVVEWHPRNQLDPTLMLPGTGKHWWICANGHEVQSTVANRIKTHGCSRCPPHQRALQIDTPPFPPTAPTRRG